MVSLADLRARDIVPTWQEAVAVVQELLHTIVATQGSADQLPDLEHIALIANGDVVALPGGRAMTEHPVRHLAQILRVLLDRSSAPPQLQEFVVANLQDPPQIDTVEEFSMQLAFFERPGRRSDVEQLVARALSTEAQTQAEEELRRLKAKALEAAEHEEEPAAEAKGPSRLQSRQAVVVAALFAFVLLAGAGWWLLGGGAGRSPQSAPGDRAEVADVVAPPAEPGEQAAAAGGSQAPPAGSGETSGRPAAASGGTGEASASGQPVGTASDAANRADTPAPSLLERTKATLSRVARAAFGPSSASENAAAAPAEETTGANAGAAAPDAEPARARRRPVRAASRPAASVSAGASPRPAAARPPSPAPQVSTVVTTPPVTGEPPMSVAETTAARTIIYTAADEEVLPALLLRPVLPEEPPPDVPPADIGTLELVVNEQGDVERVRLISPSNRFHERMLVAHAKTWKFRPAIRDGRPVKFRTVVRLTI